jgi:hypothetical protein
LAPLAAALALAACSSWQGQPLPEPAPGHVSYALRVQRSDGATVVLDRAAVTDDSVIGTAPRTHQRVAVARRDVRSVQGRHTNFLATTALTAGVTVLVVLATVAATLSTVS